MSIFRRVLAVGFVVILLWLSLMLAFGSPLRLYNLGRGFQDSLEDLKYCWVTSFQEATPWDRFWNIFNSVPVWFTVPSAAYLFAWAGNGEPPTSDFMNFENRFIYTIWRLIQGSAAYGDGDVLEWWPEIDPVTGQEIESES